VAANFGVARSTRRRLAFGATLEQALQASGLDKACVVHRPQLLSDNGSSYISDDLAKWLEDN
jgi:transposase InsO family protein